MNYYFKSACSFASNLYPFKLELKDNFYRKHLPQTFRVCIIDPDMQGHSGPGSPRLWSGYFISNLLVSI